MKPEAAREPRFSRFPTVLLVSRGALARREAVYRVAPQTLSRVFFGPPADFFPGCRNYSPSIIRHSVSQIANKAATCRTGDGDNINDENIIGLENVNERGRSGNLG